MVIAKPFLDALDHAVHILQDATLLFGLGRLSGGHFQFERNVFELHGALLTL